MKVVVDTDRWEVTASARRSRRSISRSRATGCRSRCATTSTRATWSTSRTRWRAADRGAPDRGLTRTDQSSARFSSFSAAAESSGGAFSSTAASMRSLM